MGTAVTNDIFWAFVHYVKNNRFKTIESMNEGDFDKLAEGFARENATEITDATPDANMLLGSEWSSVEWPGAISAYRNRVTCDQADYFEGHGKKAKYGA